ncbi:HD-GYP domain-containing protein [Marinobacteraceae bacterium S3BR75-40.1]
MTHLSPPGALLRRMVFAGLVLAFILSAVTTLLELEIIDEELSSSAIRLADQAQQRLPSDFAQRPEVQRERLLRRFLDEQSASADHFVAIEVYDPRHDELGSAHLGDIRRLQQELDRGSHLFSPSDNATYRRIWLDGQLYLQVWVKLDGGPQKALNGYLEGVFRIADETLVLLAGRVALAVLTVILTIALSIGVFYPVVKRQHRRINRHSQELARSNLELLKVLGNAIAKRDSDTHSHNYRVTLYSIYLARELGASPESIKRLIKGAFLHDVGKIAIPDRILHKPGRLTEKEFSVMQEHTHHGLDIIRPTQWLREAEDVVFGHHEKFDGSGYPRGLAGQAIPLAARIFCIADVFDALTSKRPYKEPFPLDKSLAILREGEGAHFDPELLALFLQNAATWYQHIKDADDATLDTLLTAEVERYFTQVGAASSSSGPAPRGTVSGQASLSS